MDVFVDHVEMKNKRIKCKSWIKKKNEWTVSHMCTNQQPTHIFLARRCFSYYCYNVGDGNGVGCFFIACLFSAIALIVIITTVTHLRYLCQRQMWKTNAVDSLCVESLFCVSNGPISLVVLYVVHQSVFREHFRNGSILCDTLKKYEHGEKERKTRARLNQTKKKIQFAMVRAWHWTLSPRCSLYVCDSFFLFIFRVVNPFSRDSSRGCYAVPKKSEGEEQRWRQHVRVYAPCICLLKFFASVFHQNRNMVRQI